MAIGHLAGPTAYDVLAWAALAWVVIRIGRTGDCRWWLAAGLILGLGIANKHSIGLFAVALVAGVLLSGGRAMVLNRWFLAGAAIAVAFTVPDLWWQAQHQWATIAMTRALNQDNGADYGGYLAQFFGSVQPVATLSNPAGIRNQEWGGHIYLCTGPISPWAQLWPLLRHYD